MPEHLMQIFYAIFITLAAAVAAANTLGVKWPWKPFNCVYCLTVWFGLICSCILNVDTPVQALVMWPVIHILAFIVYQKLI